MSVRAVFDFDVNEAYRAARVVTNATPARYLGWAFAAAALAMAAWTVVPGWGEASPGDLLLSALPYLLLGGFWLALLPMSQRRAAKKMPERDASVRGPQERVVDAVGYHSRGNGVALDVPWHAMLRGLETEDFFLFFYSKQCAYYLPKRALSAGDVGQVRAFMRAGLSERAQLAGA